MHILKYLWLILFLCSCSKTPEERFGKERDKFVYDALRNFIKAMRAKGYYAAGIGEGLDHATGKQKLLKVVFDIDELPDIEYARRIEVETLNDFLRCINGQEGIQDYLIEYPLSLKYIQIGFISRHPEEGLFSVSNYQEELSYDKQNPEKPLSPLIEVYRESFQEASQILGFTFQKKGPV